MLMTAMFVLEMCLQVRCCLMAWYHCCCTSNAAGVLLLAVMFCCESKDFAVCENSAEARYKDLVIVDLLHGATISFLQLCCLTLTSSVFYKFLSTHVRRIDLDIYH